MNNRWVVIVGALVLAAVVGSMAYNFGIEQGIQQSGKIVTVAPPAGAPYPYPYPYPYYGWHRPWGVGFFFFPLFFFVLWVVIIRALFWRGRWSGYGCRYREDPDEWHRRAHERMGNVSV